MTALSRQPSPDREYEVEALGPADDSVDLQVALPGLRTMLPARAAKPAKMQPVTAKTPQGDNAAQIIGRWTQWMKNSTGVPVPQSIVERLGKQVKALILDKYDTLTISWALAIWAAEASTVGVHKCLPETLPHIAWKYVMDGSHNALAWRNAVKQRVRQMTPSTSATSVQETKDERRNRQNAAAFADYK